MGATGQNNRKEKESELMDDTFGIKGAIAFKGAVPEKSGLEQPGNNKVTLRFKATDGNDILFQFKLSKNAKLMTIIGYKNGVPEVKCKVAVDSGAPSLDKVLASGSKTEKMQAVKMKDLFAKSTSIKEYQLGAIANKLLQHRSERNS